jgi:hypothetical protein
MTAVTRVMNIGDVVWQLTCGARCNANAWWNADSPYVIPRFVKTYGSARTQAVTGIELAVKVTSLKASIAIIRAVQTAAVAQENTFRTG